MQDSFTRALLAFSPALFVPILQGQEQQGSPKELGSVAFARDLDLVLKAKPKKPVLVVFQEIPG